MNVENISITVQEKGADTAAKHLSSLADALSKLESAASSMSSLQNLVALDRALIALTMNKNPASTVSSLANGIKTLSDALNKFDVSKLSLIGQIRGAMASFEGFSGSTTGIANGIKTLADTLKNITDDDIERIRKIADAMSGMNGFHGSTSGIAKGIESLSVTLASITDDDIEKLNKIADALSRISTNAGGLSSGASQIGSALQSTASSGHSVGSALKSISSHGHKASSSLRSLGDSAKHSTGMLGKLWASIKRIAFYRLLRTLIKNITKDFQEGLKNAYTFSKGIAGSLAQAMDGLSAQYSQMKNQMGAAFGELLQTIMPIIEAIVGAITRLMAALSALFAALGGRAKYLSAGKSEAEDWDKATGSAKEYKNTILGFDEINRLNDENGGGGGGGGADPGVWQLSDLPDWAQKIKDAIDNGDWYEAGKALAEHLNEIIENWDAYAAGKALGEKINHVIEFAFGFLKNFDFGNLGKKIAEFFNGIFDTVNWDMLGRTLVRAFTGILDFLIGFIENIDTGSIARAISNFIKGALEEATEWLGEHDWAQFGETVTDKIKDYFDNIDASGIAIDLSGFLTKLFLSIKNFFDGGDWSGVGESISSKIHEFIKNVNWKRITETLSGALISAFNAASSFVKGVNWKQLGQDVYDALSRAIEGIDFEGIAKSFFDLLGAAIAGALNFLWPFIKQIGIDIYNFFMRFINIDSEDNWLEIGAKILGGILQGIAMALANIFLWLMDNVVHPLIKGFLDVFGIHSPSKVMQDEVGIFVGQGLLEGIAAPFVAIYTWLKENVVDPIVNNFKKLFGIGDGESSTFKEFGKNIIDGLLSGLKEAWRKITEWFSEAWSGLKEWWEGLKLKAPKMDTPDYGNITLTTAGFASGGMPEMGSLFVAGEAGAEIVSNLGNGRTGVTNVEQMEAAVANGNANVVNAVYAMANLVVKAINEIDPDITLDGESLADKMYSYNQSAQRRHGAAMVT